MIFDGMRGDWTPIERRDYRVGGVIAAVLAIIALGLVLAGCHGWPNCRPGGDCAPHGVLD